MNVRLPIWIWEISLFSVTWCNFYMLVFFSMWQKFSISPFRVFLGCVNVPHLEEEGLRRTMLCGGIYGLDLCLLILCLLAPAETLFYIVGAWGRSLKAIFLTTLCQLASNWTLTMETLVGIQRNEEVKRMLHVFLISVSFPWAVAEHSGSSPQLLLYSWS